jgi:type IV pilus assembly protein PilM
MFGFGEKKYLGIDIGTSTIKIVEISVKKNKPYLSNYAVGKLGNLRKSGNEVFMDDQLANYLKEVIRRGKFSKDNVYASVPSFGGLVVMIEIPEMPQAELAQTIQFEAHKYIPLPLEDLVLSWDIVGGGNKIEAGKPAPSQMVGMTDGKTQVLLVAVPKSNVAKYQNLIKNSGLKLKALEIESFSLARSLVGKDPGKFIIIDIGSRVCNIILVEGGEIRVSRNLDAGGFGITQEISRSMNIDEERAEKLKISGNNLMGKESNLSLPIMGLITDEIKRVLGAYYKSPENIKLDGMILSGGTAKISGLDKYFSGLFNVKATVGDPLSRVEYNPKLEPKLGEIKPEFSVSVGLALKGVEEFLKNKK